MVRRLLLLLALLLLGACAENAPEESDEREQAAGSLGGSFSLRAAGPFLAGEEPVLDVHAGSEGSLALSLFRAENPESAVASFFGGSPAERETPIGKNTEFRLVWTRSHAVVAGKSTLSLGPVKPGFYVLEAGVGSKALHVPIVVSDLSLVVKRGGDEILAWVVRAGNGRPVPDATLTLFSESGPRTLELDSDAVARVDVGDVEDLRVLARAGDDIAIADATWLPPARRDRLVYVTTDRPLYRPGETVNVKGIARRVVGDRMAPFGAIESLVLIPPQGDPLPPAEPAPAINDRGTFSGAFALPEKAPLGEWRVVAVVDGRRYGGEFRVEAFRRPEAEVTVRAESALVVQGDPVKFTIAARYYAGGEVGGAAVTWSIVRTPRVRPAWRSAEASEFVGEMERRASKPVEISRGEGKLDADGTLVVEAPTERRDDDFALVLRARVRDEAGRTVSGSGSILAVRSLVTVDLRTDRESYEIGETVLVTVRVRNRNGADGAAPIRLRITADEGETETRQGRTDASGLARFEIAAETAGPLHLEITALDPREREARASRTVWVTERGHAPGYGGDGITLVPDREIYAPGDEAKVLVLLPSTLDHAKILLTVESDRMHPHRVEWIEGTSASIPVTVRSPYGAAFRVRATAVRHGRIFRGEARILAPPLEKKLEVEVSPGAETYRPGGRGFVTVRVTDRAGKPARCEVAVAGVDEALLALAPDLAPSILRFFHGPKGDRVRMFTSAEVGFHDALVIPVPKPEERPPVEEDAAFESGADEEMDEAAVESEVRESPLPTSREWEGPLIARYNSRTEQGRLPAGKPAPAPRANFTSCALWEPHALVSDTGEAVIPVTFPDDLTRWRFRAVAVDLGGRVGTGEAHAVTTRPLRLSVATPRFLTERDQVDVPVVVRSPGHAGRPTRVVVEAEARLGHATDTTLDLTLDEHARAAGSIRLTGLVRGEFPITGRAVLGDERDAVTRRIPVRAHGINRTSVLAARLDDRRPWTGEISIPRDARPGSVRVRLTFDPTHVSAIWRALDTLIDYPHGCTEQTLHRFVPVLQAHHAISLLGLEDHPRSDDIPKLVAAGLSRLGELQHEDGGWGWWEDDASDPVMSALVLGAYRFLADIARPPKNGLERGAAALAAMSARKDLDHETRALILAAIPRHLPAGYAERLFDDEVRRSASPQTLALLLQHFRSEQIFRPGKRKAEVAVLTREILAKMQQGDGGTFWGKTGARRWQDDAVETTARVIEVLASDPAQRDVVEEATRWLLSQRNGPAWQSTRDTAAAVRALLTLALETSGPKGRSAIRIRVDDGIVGQVTVSADGWAGKSVSLELPPPLLTPGAERRLTLERVGAIPVDATAVLTYVSTAEGLPAVAAGFAVTRTIHRLEPVREGDRIVHARRDPIGVRVGDLLLLETVVRPDRAAEYVECEMPFPAGAEPVRDTSAIAIEGGDLPDPPGAHVERRDDAAWFFARRAGTGEIRFRVILRATHSGDFHVLPARAGLMYFPRESGSSAEMRLSISGDER